MSWWWRVLLSADHKIGLGVIQKKGTQDSPERPLEVDDKRTRTVFIRDFDKANRIVEAKKVAIGWHAIGRHEENVILLPGGKVIAQFAVSWAPMDGWTGSEEVLKDWNDLSPVAFLPSDFPK